MKKINFLSLLTVIALAGCNRVEANPSLRDVDLKIISPKGAPAVALYKFAKGLTTVDNPATELLPQFHTNDYDVIIAPTKGGLTKITKAKVNYALAATVTFGNFALVATGNDSDGVLNEGDKVLYFQPTDIPGAVFNYLYGDKGLETYTAADDSKVGPSLSTGTYVVDETTTVNLDYVFAAEPLITNLGKTANVVERAADVFKTLDDCKAIYQASVFVNKNTDKAKINNFLSLLEDDITKAVSNPNEIVETLKLVGEPEEQAQKFKFNSTVIYNCMKDYNGLGLGFRKAFDYKTDINYFINNILNSGLTITDEAYFQ